MEVHRGSESLRPGKFIPEPISPMAGQSLEAADHEDVAVAVIMKLMGLLMMMTMMMVTMMM